MPDGHKTAIELFEEALALTKTSHKSYVVDRNDIVLSRLDRADKYLVPLYDLVPGALDPRIVEAADKFLQAGRLFETSGDRDVALRAYYRSWKLYGELRGEEFREKEALVLHFCAVLFLSLAELIADGQQKADYYRSAAEFFMRQAWVNERSNKLQEAQDAYRNASHRYYWADAMVESAHAANDLAEVSEKLGDIKSAAEAFELAAERYHAAEKIQPSPDDIDTLRHTEADWRRKAGYHYKEIGTQEYEEKALDAFNSAIATELSTKIPDLQEVIGDHLEAIKLSQESERYKELDQLRYSLFILKRKKASEEGRWLFVIWSHINDWLWGYGTKFLRLCITMTLVSLVFALAYMLLQEVQLRTNPVDPVNAPGWYALLCIGYSLYSLLPTGVIEWLTGAGLVVEFDVNGATKLLSKIEALSGLVCLAMATMVVKRMLSRLSHVKPD
jgi:tetratricopeptide (TPR) repeat protein